MVCLQKSIVHSDSILLLPINMNSQYKALIQTYQSPEESVDLVGLIIDFHPHKINHQIHHKYPQIHRQGYQKGQKKINNTQKYDEDKNSQAKRSYKRLNIDDLKQLQGYFKNNRFDKRQLSKIFGVSETSIIRFIKQYNQYGMLLPRSKFRKRRNKEQWQDQSYPMANIEETAVVDRQSHKYLRQNIENSIKQADINLIASFNNRNPNQM